MFEQLCTKDFLRVAWSRVRANGGTPGHDGETAVGFATDLEARLTRLRLELLDGAYRPGRLRHVPLRRPDGRLRLLRIPNVTDRIVQTACHRLLSQRLDARMSADSFGYRPARSVDQALNRLRALAACGKTWALDADIAAFFDRIPHDRLLDDLGIWVADQRVVSLIALWLASFGGGCGLAQGGPISPILANLYLHPLDRALTGAGIAFVRYADDFVALAEGRPAAQKAHTIVAATLGRRGLALQPEKTRILPLTAGLNFLGQRLEFAPFAPAAAGRPGHAPAQFQGRGARQFAVRSP